MPPLTVRPCRTCADGVCEVNRQRCYRCLHPDVPPPACKCCGSGAYYVSGYCRACHPRLGIPESCRSCLAWCRRTGSRAEPGTGKTCRGLVLCVWVKMCRMDAGNLDGFVIRPGEAADWAGLSEIDSVAVAGDEARRSSICRWSEQGLVLMAEEVSGPLGYVVLEYTFFEQGFVTMLMVGSNARRRGVGTRLLEEVAAVCTAPKLFTSTNVSNHPMQRLLQYLNWRPVGLVHGLDENDPELFYLCPADRIGGVTGRQR